MILVIKKLLIFTNFISGAQVQCEQDSDCSITDCEFCLSTKTCVKFNHRYCRDNSFCGLGDGNCDVFFLNQCKQGFECGPRSFLDFHPYFRNLTHCDNRIHQRGACVPDNKSNIIISNRNEALYPTLLDFILMKTVTFCSSF